MTKVNGNGNGLTPEEIKARREAFNKIKEEGHEIILTARPGKNSGVSYDYMDRLNKDIEAGIFEDNNKDGQNNKFSNYDKRNLGNEFTSVFSEHGYSTKFTRMQAGEQYAISYDDYVRLADAAGYVLKEEEQPAPAPVEKKMPEIKPVPFVVPQPTVKDIKITPIQVQQPKTEPNDTVTWDITETEYPDGSKERVGSYTVNGQETPVREFVEPDAEQETETVVAEPEIDAEAAPAQGKKEAQDPDTVPAQAPQDNPTAPASAVAVSNPFAAPVVEEAPAVEEHLLWIMTHCLQVYLRKKD